MSLSIFEAALDSPERLALMAGGTELTFRALAERAALRLGELERARSLDPAGERPVAVVASPSLASVETLLALFAVGTPALLLHPRSSAAERAELVERAGAILEPPAASVAAAKIGARLASSVSPTAFSAERIAALVPTSGTTGAPRLAKLSHRALSAAARASAEHLGIEDDRWLAALPLAHVGGLMILVRSLTARSATVLFEPAPSLLSRLDALAAALRDSEVTLLSLVPTVLDRLLAPPHCWKPAASLRAVLVGGAACPSALLETAYARRVPVLTTYGLTETCAQVATRPYRARLDPPRLASALAPAGIPLQNIDLRLSERGVLEVRGPSLFSGYAGEPGTDPGAGWFTTHDRGFFTPEGEVTISGRRSDLVITGGENVDPVEVEAALAALGGVVSACVIGVEDPTFGEIVTALLVVTPEGPRTLEAVNAPLRARLASFKLPRKLLLVPELPLLPSGKLDRGSARSRYLTAQE